MNESDIMPIPFDSFFQTVAHAVFRNITKKFSSLINASQRMRYITLPIRAMKNLHISYFRIKLTQIVLQIIHRRIQCSPLSKSGIINLIDCIRIGGCHGKHIHLDYIVNVSKITAVFTITVNHGTLVCHQFLHK